MILQHLMKASLLMTLDKWREPDEIFRLCYPVYVRRETDGELDAPIVEKIKSYQEKYGKVVRRIVTPAIELSSTDVRAAVAEGFPIEGAVPPAVADYIHTHGLYRNA